MANNDTETCRDCGGSGRGTKHSERYWDEERQEWVERDVWYEDCTTCKGSGSVPKKK